MKVAYAPKAIADRVEIIGYYRQVAGLGVADAFDRRLQEAIEHLRKRPEIGLGSTVVPVFALSCSAAFHTRCSIAQTSPS